MYFKLYSLLSNCFLFAVAKDNYLYIRFFLRQPAHRLRFLTLHFYKTFTKRFYKAPRRSAETHRLKCEVGETRG